MRAERDRDSRARDIAQAWITAYYHRQKKLPSLKAELAKLGTSTQPKVQSVKTHRVMLEMIGAQIGVALVKKPKTKSKVTRGE